jgi:hypothetical protein
MRFYFYGINYLFGAGNFLYMLIKSWVLRPWSFDHSCAFTPINFTTWHACSEFGNKIFGFISLPPKSFTRNSVPHWNPQILINPLNEWMHKAKEAIHLSFYTMISIEHRTLSHLQRPKRWFWVIRKERRLTRRRLGQSLGAEETFTGCSPRLSAVLDVFRALITLTAHRS